jgi:acetylornithine deacetylase/succinyl-diaminopimelate desuccinylase-like protein
MTTDHLSGTGSPDHRHGPACGCTTEKGRPLYAQAPSPATEKALAYVEAHLAESLDSLSRLVAIPSVSLEAPGSKAMRSSAEATAETLQAAGLEKVTTLQFGDVHPYVYGEWIHKPDAPTLLLYAHHDVQPSGRDDKWRSRPFEAKVRDGRLFGRGTADDKAGILAHTAAIAAFLRTSGELPVNVKVLIEGEEETGSTHLGEFVRRHRDTLRADAMVLTDCANFDTGVPSITTSLRGLVAVDVEIEALAHPVHSGMWGGILPDPVVALAKLLATLTDERGDIAIPGLTKDVRALTAVEARELRGLAFGDIPRQATGLLPELPFPVASDRFGEHLWRLPSLSVNAIQSGSRKLVSNIIQDGAWARVSIRIVPDMRPQDVLAQLTRHLTEACPAGFRLTVTPESAGDWWILDDVQKPAYQIAARALEKGYGREIAYVGCGGSIPFVQPLSKELGGIPAILVGVEDPYTNAHSENESLHLGDFRKTLLGQVHMLAYMARYQRA